MVLEMEMSKTYQYRKVMKPMLERKRRARINKCLDELKDIMVECLTQEGEHITRLEKADILELTVEHMKKLRAQKQLRLTSTIGGSGSGIGMAAASSVAGQQEAKLTIAESFRAGYVHAANEVSKTLATVPGVSVDLGTKLMSHLGHRLNYLQVIVPSLPATIMGAMVATPAATAAAAATVAAATQHSAFAAFGGQTMSSSSASTSPSPLPTSSSSVSSSSSFFGSGVTSPTVGLMADQRSPALITPPPSECGSSDSGSCSPSPALSETSANGSMWRPW